MVPRFFRCHCVLRGHNADVVQNGIKRTGCGRFKAVRTVVVARARARAARASQFNLIGMRPRCRARETRFSRCAFLRGEAPLAAARARARPIARSIAISRWTLKRSRSSFPVPLPSFELAESPFPLPLPRARGRGKTLRGKYGWRARLTYFIEFRRGESARKRISRRRRTRIVEAGGRGGEGAFVRERTNERRDQGRREQTERKSNKAAIKSYRAAPRDARPLSFTRLTCSPLPFPNPADTSPPLFPGLQIIIGHNSSSQMKGGERE